MSIYNIASCFPSTSRGNMSSWLLASPHPASASRKSRWSSCYPPTRDVEENMRSKMIHLYYVGRVKIGQNRIHLKFINWLRYFQHTKNLWFFWGAKNCGPIPMCSALRKQKERIELHWTSRNPVVCRHLPMTNSWVLNKNSDLTSDQMLPSSWNVGTAMNPHTNSCTNVQYTINKHHCPAEKIS